jgi:hypothetical protein
MIPIPVCFSSFRFETLVGEMTRGIGEPHAYCSRFSCLALTLAAGAGPGARRAIRRPDRKCVDRKCVDMIPIATISAERC